MPNQPSCWGPTTVAIGPRLRADARIRWKTLYQNNEIRTRPGGAPIPTCGSGIEKYPFPRNLRRSSGQNARKYAKLEITIPKPFRFTEREVFQITVNLNKNFWAGGRPISPPRKFGKGPIVPKIFTFMTAERSKRSTENLKNKLFEMERKRLEAVTFFAKTVPLTNYVKPLKPAPSLKPLVQPVQVNLITQFRTKERNNYNQKIKDKVIMNEIKNMQEEARRAEREKIEELKMRQGLIFKANPVPIYRIMQIKASTLPLTVPRSPNFSVLPSQRRKQKE